MCPRRKWYRTWSILLNRFAEKVGFSLCNPQSASGVAMSFVTGGATPAPDDVRAAVALIFNTRSFPSPLSNKKLAAEPLRPGRQRRAPQVSSLNQD